MQYLPDRCIVDLKQIGDRTEIGRERDDCSNVQITIRPPIQPVSDTAGPWIRGNRPEAQCRR